MKIKIHRGTHQIGGCVTEYEYKGWRLFVDYGEELPGGPKTGDLQVEGLTHGDVSKSALLITHYHGDHIGNIPKLPKDLPIYMGKLARDIQLILSNHLKNKLPIHKEMVERLQAMLTFEERKAFSIGPFNIMPVTVDHSAFDAYAFRIEADDVSVYHSGDFRLHGFRSKKFPEMIRKYIGKVDYVVCEATNILRPNASSKKESTLQHDFVSLFKENKNTVMYLSSTNIDRLFALYHAALKAGRPFFVDAYQKEIMDVVVNSHSIWTNSELYQYKNNNEPKPLIYHKFDVNRFFVSDSFKDYLDRHGFVLIARTSERFVHLLEQIPGEKKKVLSMWDGYVKEGTEAYNENLASSIGDKFDYMHTSGHVDMKDLRELFRLLHPKAIIPIHTDKPEEFAKVFSDAWPVLLLNDGESIAPISSRIDDSCCATIFCTKAPSDDAVLIQADDTAKFWGLDEKCLGYFKTIEEAESVVSHVLYRPDYLLGYEVEDVEDDEPVNLKVFDQSLNLLAVCNGGCHRPGEKNYQLECRFKEGEKVLAVLQAGYLAVVPATVIGPVDPEIWRKEFEADVLASSYYDSYEDFEKTLLDFDWDSVAVRPHVRLEVRSNRMGKKLMFQESICSLIVTSKTRMNENPASI